MPNGCVWLLLPLLIGIPHLAADEAESPVREEVRLIPMVSLKADVRAAMDLLDYAKSIEIENTSDLVLFDIISFGEQMPKFPKDSDPLIARYEIYLVNSILSGEWGYLFDIVIPGGHDGLKAMAEEDYEVSEQGDDVYLFDNTPCIANERYFAIAQIGEDGIDSGNELTRLRKLIAECQNEHLAPTMSISARPAAVSRSFVNPTLKAFRATLLTQAQRRDEDDDLAYLTRALYQKTAVSLFDALFQGIEEFEFAFTFDDYDKTCSVATRIEATKDSITHEYIRKLYGTRNRSLSWLHPDNTMFVSFSLPLTDLIRQTLPALSREFMATLHRATGLPGAPGPAFERVMNQFTESGKLEFLWQMMSDGDSHAAIVVVPLASASALESTSIELISATNSDTWQLNVGDIEGWPVHRLAAAFDLWDDPLDAKDMHWVLTDNCLALILRNNAETDPVESLRQIVTRDFEESALARRLSQSCFAASTTATVLSELDEEFLPKVLRERLNEDQSLSLEDRVTFAVTTDQHEVEVRATFERDALLAGIRTFEYGVMWLVSWLDELD